MTNPFFDFAEKQTPAPVKARIRAAEKRTATAAEKKLAEREQTHRLWKKHRAERVGELLKGPYAKATHELLVLADEAALLALVKRGLWRAADSDTCFEILSLIDAALTTKREAAGLPPFDDALPGAPPTTFLTGRRMLI
jgi:hypothetical protein